MTPDDVSKHLEDPEFQSILVDCYRAMETGTAVQWDELQTKHPQYAAAIQALRDDAKFLGALARSRGADFESDESELTIDSNATTHKFAVGDQIEYIGEYKVIREIARGGMGIVFEAKQQSLKRHVALKMILPGRFATEADVGRFRREAAAAAGLQHANIVAVHEVGQHEGHHYFSMDLVEGRSLAEAIREESLPPRKAAELVKTVAEAMHYAHEQGTLHRDLKPANVLLDANGMPKITDFGLAKTFDLSADETQHQLTVTGEIIGTPSYMSPEQAAGKADLVDRATDVYSIGAILYACLTGHAPFVAETPVETLLQVANNDPVAPRTFNRKIPRELETICLNCLAKKPNARYPSAKALADDLARWLEGKPIKARRAGVIKRSWKWMRRHPTSTTLLMVLVAAAATSTWLWRRAEKASDLAADQLYVNQIALAEREWQARNRSRAMELLMECDPQRQGWEWKLVSRLCFATPHVSLPTQKTFIDQARFDPSGMYLVTSEKDRLRVWSADGMALLFAVDEPVERFDFDPNGKRLAATFGNDVKMVDLESGDVSEPLFHSEEPLHNVSFDVAGERLAILDMKNKLTVVQLSTKGKLSEFSISQVIVRGSGTSMRFHPSGDRDHLMVFHDDNIGHNRFVIWDVMSQQSVATLKLSDEESIGSKAVINMADDGKRLVVRVEHAGTTTLRCFDLVRKESIDITPGLGGSGKVTAVAFDPAGDTIAVAVLEMNIGVEDVPGAKNDLAGFMGTMFAMASKARPWHTIVYLYDVESGRQLREFRGIVGHVNSEGMAFHPDGKRLITAGGFNQSILSNDQTVIGELKLWDAVDPSPSLVLLGHEHEVRRVAISPNGQLIASGDVSGQVRVWRTTGQLVRVLQTGGGQSWDSVLKGVAFTSDGKQLIIADDNQLAWWDLTTARKLHQRVRGDENDTQILSLSASPNGKLIGFHTRKRAYVLESESRKQLFSVEHSHVRRVVIGPNNQQVALPHYYDLHGELKTFDIASGREQLHVETEKIGSLFRTGYGLLNATFSPNGSTVVGVGNNGPAMIWDSRSGALLHELTGHSGFIWAVAYCPDGRRIATGGTDSTIKLWNPDTAQEMITLRGHYGRVNDLAFSPDGKLLVSVGDDKTVRIWNSDLESQWKDIAPEADGIDLFDSAPNWNTPTDPDSRRQVLWGRDMMIALQAYEQQIRRSVGHEIKYRYNIHTSSYLRAPSADWPSKEESRGRVTTAVAPQRQAVIEINERDGDGIHTSYVQRDLGAIFDKAFNQEYDKQYAVLKQEYDRRFEKSRKWNLKKSKDQLNPKQ